MTIITNHSACRCRSSRGVDVSDIDTNGDVSAAVSVFLFLAYAFTRLYQVITTNVMLLTTNCCVCLAVVRV